MYREFQIDIRLFYIIYYLFDDLVPVDDNDDHY